MKAPTRKQIEKAIDELRETFRADGGDIELVGYKDGVVTVRLVGACASCPMASLSLAFGVEKQLKERFPAIKRVEPAPL
jgi:Fe-S cluster biogenesis protein NfuA